jgi:hypothetical protein
LVIISKTTKLAIKTIKEKLLATKAKINKKLCIWTRYTIDNVDI